MKTRAITVVLVASLAWSAPLVAAEDKTAQLTIKADQGKDTINRNIYGHFAEHLGRCIYDGYLGRARTAPSPTRAASATTSSQALREIKIPVLRWPGGCFADEYHWKDGIGPREKRPTMINTHWGGVTENNHFGTHEFLDLCEQLGCEPYICGNVGSGTVRGDAGVGRVHHLRRQVSPMADLRGKNGREEPWKLTYFGVGNENWGCGGNMRPEYYADQYRRYDTYVRNFGDNRIFKIACGANADDYRLDRGADARTPARQMDGLSLHYYTVPTGNWQASGSATQFDEADWFATVRARAARWRLWSPSTRRSWTSTIRRSGSA